MGGFTDLGELRWGEGGWHENWAPVTGEAFMGEHAPVVRVFVVSGASASSLSTQQASHPPVNLGDTLLDSLGTKYRTCWTAGKSLRAPEIMSLLIAEVSLFEAS